MKAEVFHSRAEIDLARGKLIRTDEVRRRFAGRFLVATKGAFDVLHGGHMALLSRLGSIAKAQSGAAIVGVATDSLIRRLKGPTRPYQAFEDRSLQIALHPNVDAVVEIDDQDLSSWLEAVQPDLFIKGQDTAGVVSMDLTAESIEIDDEKNPEGHILSRRGILFAVFCDDGRVSTTKIAETIRS